MFSYYGSKSKLVDLYPAPKHGLIIEPFAGTARYSLKYFDNEVILYELFHKVFRIWKFLQQASEKDIMQLPSIGYKEKIPTTLSDEERWLIGFCVGRGSPRPATMGHKFNAWESDKKRISKNLYKIRHWNILNEDGTKAENKLATWYIDPPYQKMGYKYNFNKIDYDALAKFSINRKGLVIVCENIDADWMDFEPLVKFRGAHKTNVEAIWLNQPREYQPSMM